MLRQPLLILVFLAALLATPAGAQNAAEGEMAPDFTMTTMNGDTIALSKLRGKVVVINFWFINCPPCREEIPGLNRLVTEFASKNVVFVAPATDKRKALAKLLAKESFSYQVIPSARGLAGLYKVEGFPTHLVIGTDGKIVKRMLGGGKLVPMILRPIIASLVKGSATESN